MGPFVLAWLFGEGLIAWRSASEQHMPPSPRQLLVASGLYAGLAVAAEYAPARGVATAFAWAVNVAVLMRVLPGSGDAAAIKAGSKSGWAGIGMAGNSVVIPDGSAASTAIVTTAAVTGTGTGGAVSTSGISGGGNAAANQQVAQQIIAQNSQFAGWNTGSQWDCLVKLWNQESGWSASAHNPSGATGIPQSLPASKMASAGADYLTNPVTQIKWGLGYIASRYGTPCGAWAHEQSNNWY